MAGITHEIVRHEPKSGVAKSRHGVEHGGKRGKALGVEDVEGNGPHSLDKSRDRRHAHQETSQVEGGVMEQALANGDVVGQGHPASPEIEDKRGKGHDAQAPELDQGQDDGVAEAAVGRAGVHHGQARDAGGGSGGEQRVEKGDRLPGAADRLAQKPGPEKNGRSEEMDGQGQRGEDLFQPHGRVGSLCAGDSPGGGQGSDKKGVPDFSPHHGWRLGCNQR